MRDLFFLACLLFLLGVSALGDRLGLVVLSRFLLAEDGFITIGEILGFRQTDTNDAHLNYPLPRAKCYPQALPQRPTERDSSLSALV